MRDADTHTHTHKNTRRRLTGCCVSPRLLKAMGWQEYPENDDNFLPLTEDELREFQTKTEQVGPTMGCSAGQEGRKAGRKSFMNPQAYLINLDILLWLLQSCCFVFLTLIRAH